MGTADQGNTGSDGMPPSGDAGQSTVPGAEASPSTQGGVDASNSSSMATLLQTSTPAVEAPAAPEGESAEPDFSEWFGRTIDGRYKIVELLGEGGMGAVFVAEHLSLRKQVALKIIRPEFAGVPEIAARFTREAMATGKLDHPHVASALDYGMLPDGAAYLVIQLVRGKALRNLLDERSLPWPTACDIAGQIADALAGAHAEGIVHRDLKPDNVLLELRDDGRYLAKVVDFGIARVATDPSAAAAPGDGLTRMGMVMGTPGYMSPEQALGEAVDHRTDLYALGVVLWESIAGRPLFVAESLTELIAKQLADAPTPLASVTGLPIPEPIDELILQLLSRTPASRPESAAEVRDMLRKFAAAGSQGEGDLATLPGGAFGVQRRTERAPTVTMVPRPPSAISRLQAELRRRWAQDRRSMLALGGVVGVLLLVGLIGLASGDDEGSSDDPRPPSEAMLMADTGGDEATRDADRAEDADEAKDKDRAKDKAKDKAKDDPDADKDPAATGGDEGGGQQGILAAASEIAGRIDALLNGDEAGDRRAAAAELLEEPDGLPPVIVALAELELAKRCKDKKAKIIALTKLGDPQVRPALERVSALPRKGCTPFGQGDCWKCLRRTVKSSLATLAKAGDKDDAPDKTQDKSKSKGK